MEEDSTVDSKRNCNGLLAERAPFEPSLHFEDKYFSPSSFQRDPKFDDVFSNEKPQDMNHALLYPDSIPNGTGHSLNGELTESTEKKFQRVHDYVDSSSSCLPEISPLHPGKTDEVVKIRKNGQQRCRPSLDMLCQGLQQKAARLEACCVDNSATQEKISTSDNEETVPYRNDQDISTPLDFSRNNHRQGMSAQRGVGTDFADSSGEARWRKGSEGDSGLNDYPTSSTQEKQKTRDKDNCGQQNAMKMETLMKLRECHLCGKHFVSYEDPIRESLRKHSVCDHCLLQCSSLREDIEIQTERKPAERGSSHFQSFAHDSEDFTGIKTFHSGVSDFQDLTTHYLDKYKGEIHHSKPFTCDICFKSFTLNGSLTRHKRIHSGQRPYECDICERSFAEKGDLMKHKRIHSGDKPYMCDICNKGFTQSSGLIVHKRMHFDERPYKCDVCGKGFAATGQLTIHKRKHSGDRPYKCEVCGKSFASNSRLTLHKNTHLANRPFNCDVCGKGFACNSNLNVHKRIHSGEKMFKCDVCGRGFARSDSLAVHKRMHTGERPYKCDKCEETFVQSYGLKVHRKRTGH